MDFSPSILYLSISYTCNFACRDCYAVADRALDLPLPMLDDIIDGAAEAGFSQIWLSGGEITLFPEKMDRLSKRINDRKVQAGILSNAWFGADEKMQDRLKGYLKHVQIAQISVDSFHEETFKQKFPGHDYASCIRTATSFLIENGIYPQLRAIDTPASAAHNTDLLSRLPGDLEVFRSPCLPYGRGQQLTQDSFELKPFSEILETEGGPCPANSLGISPIGVYFCCTPPGATDDFTLMKPEEFPFYRKDIIKESLKRANNSENVRIILKDGIKDLYKKANGIGTYKDCEGVNPCSVCQYSIHKLGGL